MINIEKCVIDYLHGVFREIPVSGMKTKPGKRMLVVDRTGGSIYNLIPTSSVVVDSYAETKAQASMLNDQVIDAMMEMPGAVTEIAHVSLNSTYDDTDTTSKEYRYGALFEIVHS